MYIVSANWSLDGTEDNRDRRIPRRAFRPAVLLEFFAFREGKRKGGLVV